MLKQKLILGTVQFGLNYGINNVSGKPDVHTVFGILDTAWEHGIKTLDTADAYGDAIEQIGNYHRARTHRFNILSKFKGAKPGEIEGLARVSLEKLDISCFGVYSYHSMADYQAYPHIKQELLELKDKGLVQKTGISVYTNDELKQVTDDPDMDVIQLPFNMLDNNHQRGKLIREAKQKGKEIHIRSAFLQGLFFMPENSIPEKLAPLKPYLQQLNALCKGESVSLSSAALSYAVCQPDIDQVLIGVDSRKQLSDNLESINCNEHLFEQIDKNIKVAEVPLLNPVNWK